MRETTTSAAAAVDMISDLSDDVLLLILGFLLSARDVVRTSVLSRRWRHLWTLAPTLRFAVGKPACWTITEDEVAAACRLIPAVDSVLARRDDAGGPDVKDLEISFVYRPGGDVPNDYDLFQYGYDAKDITRERVAAWVRFAESRVTETFTLEVPMGKSRWRDKWRAPLVADLPRSERFRAMQLMLGGAILRIRPDAGAFRALTDVLLSQVTLRDGDDLRLCHLLSSTCCPQLRRLEIRNIYGLTNLRLDAAGTLEELLLDNLCPMRRMQVDAPGLRELTVLNICVHVATAASISAPRLRLLTCANMCGRFDRMVLDGTGIAKLRVLSHGDPGRNDNRAAAWFLQHCAAADRLEVEVMMKLLQDIEDVMKDIPKLPNITDLRIKASIRTGTMDTHCIGASITKLIAKCNRIEYLSIDIDEKAGDCTDPHCECDQPKGWDKEKISLERLRIVNIHGFQPFNDQITLVCLLLENAPALERMTVALQEFYVETKEIIYHNKVYLYLPYCGGSWTPCAWECCGSKFGSATKYEWTPCK